MPANSEMLIQKLQNPSLDYNPVVMWFWNGSIDEAGITFQLEKFREQNVVQFFIHPAGGMDVPYMSDRFLKLIRHAVMEAKRLGMKYWIYDENDWPSGMAGGLIREQYPESKQKEIYYQKEILNGIDNSVCINRKGSLICAQRVTLKEGRYFVTDVTDLCEVITDGECVHVEYQCRNVLGEEVLFCFSQHSDRVIYASLGRLDSKAVRGYINVLREEYIAKFIEMTHERYKAVIGDEFGKTVMGIFTDEPTSFYRFEGNHPGPWDDDFFDMFMEDHGYSFRPYLYTLVYEPISLEEIKARDDYRETVGNRYQNAFIRPISKWCHENNLILTGHFGGEEDLLGHMAQGDMQTEAMVLDIPGLDSIHSKYAIHNYHFNIAGKLIAGAAKYKNVDRVLCETYTLSGWNLDFTVMRRIANRLLMLGANMIQYMGAAYSLHCGRKSMGGPPHGYMNPMFQHYHAYNKYIAGISAVSAATRPMAKVLLFTPLRQIIQKYNFEEGRHRSDCIPTQRIYEDTVNALLWSGIGFDIFSENLADQIVVRDGYVEAFGYRYESLVFPDMYFVNQKVAELIQALISHNVKTIFAHEVPAVIADKASELNLGLDWNGMDADPNTMEVLADGNHYLLYPVNWPATMEGYCEKLKQIIGDVTLHIRSKGRVYIGERGNADCDVYFICNDEDHKVYTEIDWVRGMRILDAWACEEIPYTVKDNRVELALEAYTFLVVFCDKQSENICVTTNKNQNLQAEDTQNITEISLGNQMSFRTEGGNYLPVEWEVYDKETETWEACNKFFYPPALRLKPSESVKLRAKVSFAYMPDCLMLHTEIYGVTDLRINGKACKPMVNAHRFSEWDYCEDVTSFIQEGENLIEMETITEPMCNLSMPPFAFFSGSFLMDSDGKIVPPVSHIRVGNKDGQIGGWETKGYPHFYGNAVYTAEVNIQQEFAKAELMIPSAGPVEVFVNGMQAGLLLWKPFNVDVTSVLHTGTNKIELRLTSTLNNIFDTPMPAGITGEVKLILC